ncbi:uncharacterized protein LOC115125485, partial [Oncorhynchus nerka]|uniref:uncharacterized protein LOC115125485 n=1 Tax=Oncorhynchus nerka TaxID=8023 RepID=UPI0031B83C90
LHKRGQPKHKRELPRANPLCVKGRRVSLVANFVKRHFNLRCIVKHQYGELRVFPERYVVCVSRLEDASANPTPAVTVSQSTESQYFSRPAAETRDELNSSTITKRSSLQKIARHANARPRPETQPLPCGSVLVKNLHSEQNRVPGEQVPEPQPPTDQPRLTTDAVLPHGHPTTSTDPTVQAGAVGGVGLTEGKQRESVGLPGNTDPRDTVLSQSQSQGGEDEPSRVPGNTDPRDTVLSQSQSQGGEDEPSRVPGNTDPRDTVLSQSQSQGGEDEPSRVPGNTDPRDTVLSQSQSQGGEDEPSRVPGNTDPRDTVLSQSQSQDGEDEPSRVPGEDPPRAKRVCLGPLLVACSSNDLITPTHSAESSNPLLPPPPPLSSPRPPVVKSSAKTESEAFPALFPAPAAPLSPLPAPAPEKDQSTAPLSPLPAPERTQSTAPLSPLPAPERTQSTAPSPLSQPQSGPSPQPLSPLSQPQSGPSPQPLSPLSQRQPQSGPSPQPPSPLSQPQSRPSPKPLKPQWKWSCLLQGNSPRVSFLSQAAITQSRPTKTAPPQV